MSFKKFGYLVTGKVIDLIEAPVNLAKIN